MIDHCVILALLISIENATVASVSVGQLTDTIVSKTTVVLALVDREVWGGELDFNQNNIYTVTKIHTCYEEKNVQ